MSIRKLSDDYLALVFVLTTVPSASVIVSLQEGFPTDLGWWAEPIMLSFLITIGLYAAEGRLLTLITRYFRVTE